MNLYTFSPCAPFITQLAAHVLSLPPETLILLPTRRACLAFQDACLRLNGGAARLLPRTRPIGEVDEHALWLEGGVEEAASPAISRLRREALLTRLVAQFMEAREGREAGREQALLLAQALAELLDAAQREEVGFDRLEKLAPHELATHWQQTVDFLRIVTVQWPALLREEGKEDPVRRRNALLRALAAGWAREAPPYPVIAAGSTGSQPAVAALMKVIAGLPQGQVILPGLDLALPASAWEELGETHPQAGLKRLLAAMEAERAQVRLIGTEAPTCPPARIELLRAAMLPPGYAALAPPEGVAGIRRLDCANPQEEAGVIAIILRETLEIHGKKAALVTPDRQLARRVKAALLVGYGVEVDDSAGTPVLDTPPGVFLRLLAELTDMGAVKLLSLLKHPLARAGMDGAACRRAARTIEKACLRGVRLDGGIGSIRALLKDTHGEAHALLDYLEQYLSPWMGMFSGGKRGFSAMLETHIATAEALGADLWQGQDGLALANALAELRAAAEAMGDIRPRDYAGMLRALLAASTHRKPYGAHPRLHILSPQEARLLDYDVVVLGGLNEGIWPAAPEVSPWMSRPMLERFGLPAPARAIGVGAHDFAMLCAAREVVLTRSVKAEGTITQPSRWLMRLDLALHAGTGAPWRWEEGAYAHWHRTRMKAEKLPPLSPPAPAPPLEARPRKLAITEVDAWVADPYAIYAKHVLGLKKLEQLDRAPDMREFGTLVHAALCRFAERWPEALPENTEAELVACGREAFAAYHDRPAVRAFWWPRFEAIARWVAGQEHTRRREGMRVLAEVSAEVKLGDFTLRTRLDRVEHAGGEASVVDYKTGYAPTKANLEKGRALQLPLEALAVQGTRLHELAYWKLGGERGEEAVMAEGEAAQALAARAEAFVRQLIALFDDPATPYLVEPLGRERAFNDYAHLERAAEWRTESVDGGSGGLDVVSTQHVVQPRGAAV